MQTCGTDRPRRIQDDMRRYCEVIGNRLAGSAAEKRAAEYTAERFSEMGLSNVALLPFVCRGWTPGGGRLEVLGDSPHTLDIQTVTHTPPTPEGGIEGDLVFLEEIDYRNGLRATDGLDGRIGLFFGQYGESARVYRELQESPLAALIFVDTRLVTEWPIAEGMGEKFMGLVKKPMANLAMMDAWRLKREGATRVRLHTAGVTRHATSHNVVGELPGKDDGRVIVVCGHIDSVSAGVGADDNAGGMAAVLECARQLAQLTQLAERDGRRHTVRFIGFGAEEQLSVGSMRYIKEQIADLDRVAFVCNFDSCGALLGASKVMCTGTDALERHVCGVVTDRLGHAEAFSDACPYQDQFWFTARGVPGVWFTRITHPAGRWYHHSAHNNLANVSCEQVARAADAACALLGDLVATPVAEWPFPLEIAPELAAKIDGYVRDLFE